MSDCAASSPTSSTAAPLIDGAAESAAERMAPAARHLERVAQREDAARQLAQRRERGETLSKAEQKRLRKFETRDEYKEIRKMERKRRKLAREAKASQQAQDEHQLPRETVGVERSLPPLDELKLRAWEFWRGIGSPTCVLAPMVNQSELPFRLLARKHGAQLTYTPMLHSVHFAMEESYRQDNFDPHPEDRPLIVQFCGDDPHTLLKAAKHVEGKCDGIELNCGCPQGIARRGHYGAFLLDEPDLIVSIVEHLSKNLITPVMVKMRVVRPRAAARTWEPAIETPGDPPGLVEMLATDEEARMYMETMRLGLRLQAAGAVVLTLHGRTKEEKKNFCRECDWQAIAALKRVVSIPVVANGGIETAEDFKRCLAVTKADAVMSSEAALENPAIFGGAPVTRLGQARLAREYIELTRQHMPRCPSVVKAHLFKLLYMALEAQPELRSKLGSTSSLASIYEVAESVLKLEVEEAAQSPDLMNARCDVPGSPFVSWYRRHRPYTIGSCLGDEPIPANAHP